MLRLVAVDVLDVVRPHAILRGHVLAQISEISSHLIVDLLSVFPFPDPARSSRF